MALFGSHPSLVMWDDVRSMRAIDNLILSAAKGFGPITTPHKDGKLIKHIQSQAVPLQQRRFRSCTVIIDINVRPSIVFHVILICSGPTRQLIPAVEGLKTA